MVKGINIGEECWVCNANFRESGAKLRVGKVTLVTEADRFGLAECKFGEKGETIPFNAECEIFKSLEEIIERYGNDYEFYS